MKQPKKLTLSQKKLVSAAGLIPSNWMLHEETKDYIVVISKSGKSTKKILK